MIDISKLDKANVLCALYTHSHPQGRGWLQSTPEPMTKEQAEALLKQGTYFDYVKGRVLKVDLSGTSFDPYLYDRDNGQGAAQRAIDAIRKRIV
jgi:hypothetical protein